MHRERKGVNRMYVNDYLMLIWRCSLFSGFLDTHDRITIKVTTDKEKMTNNIMDLASPLYLKKK